MPPALAPIITPSFLHSLRTQPHLPRHCWYFIAGVTLSVLNRPEEIPKVLECALGGYKEHGRGQTGQEGGNGPQAEREREGEGEGEAEESPLQIARKMREALIKAAPIGGLPKTINALLSLKACTPPSLLDLPPHPPPTTRTLSPASLPPTLSRGAAFFAATYGKVTARVQSQMDNSGTGDLGLTARLLYGYILSETSVLSARETSFGVIAGLVPLDVNAQLKGHLRGAVNHGARVEEVRAVRAVVVRICEGGGMVEGGGGGWGWRGEVANL